MLQAAGVDKRIGSRLVLRGVSLQVQKGEFFGIIGPNGSGKSTLIKLLSGVEPPSAGKILLQGTNLAQFSRKQLAQHVAVLQQEALPPVGFTVREVAEMGRYPYQNWLGEEWTDAGELIDQVLAELDLTELADRPVEALSGGERQRAALAKVTVQQPDLLMLDEPTTYLDIGYQQQMMDYVRAWQRSAGLTVVAVLHDLNLAALYCDRIMVLCEGEVLATGTPETIIRAEILEQAYGIRPTIVVHPQRQVPQILL